VLSAWIGEWEAARGLPPGRIGLIALVESPAGLLALSDLVAVPRVAGLALGTEDFSVGLGAPPTADSLDLPCRLLAIAAATRGLMALGLPLSITEIRDLDAVASAACAGRRLGLTGALCVHPLQVEAVNRAFDVTAEERAAAQRIVEVWDAHGGAGVTQVDGRMVDLPVALRAQALLRRGDP